MTQPIPQPIPQRAALREIPPVLLPPPPDRDAPQNRKTEGKGSPNLKKDRKKTPQTLIPKVVSWALLGLVYGQAGVSLAAPGASFQTKMAETPDLWAPQPLQPPLLLTQLLPDTTLGAESSTVRSTGTPLDAQGNPEQWIEGGADRGPSLFHSFSTFQVRSGERVFFNPSATVEHIFTRITGRDPSQILGTLGVRGSANLFFLNPNGIYFGPEARLQFSGSFFAITAAQLNFNHYTFSATAPTAPPLLTIHPPRSVQFGPETPGPIDIAGNGNQLRLQPTENPNLAARFAILERNQRPAGLSVGTGQSLGLLGGPITLSGGNLTAAGGQILLASVGATAGSPEQTIALTAPNGATAGNWSLSPTSVQNWADIRLQQASSIDTSGSGSGFVQIYGQSLQLEDGSAVLALTLGNQLGNGIQLHLEDTVALQGANAWGAPSVIQTGVQPGAMATAGSINLVANQLQLQQGAAIGSSTAGLGNGGDLNLIVRERISLTGLRQDGVGALVESRVLRSGVGHAGTLRLSTGLLILDDGAAITASTLGQGNAGDLAIQARDIQLQGRRGDGFRTFIANIVGRTGEGSAGNLQIDTDRLWLRDGAALTASTDGEGLGGNLWVTARESIRLEGQTEGGEGSALLSRVSPRGTEDAGNLRVSTAQLLLQDGATLSAENLGAGEGGNIEINALNSVLLRGGSSISASNQGQKAGGNIKLRAATLQLRDQSFISAATTSAQGGNIQLDLDRSLLLAEGSYISAEAGTAQSGGNGGDIRINAPFIVALGGENSAGAWGNNDIIANAFRGSGGNIVINTVGLLGFTVANVNQPRSDWRNNITASSRFGIARQPDISSRLGPAEQLLPLQTQAFASAEVILPDRCNADTRSTLQLLGQGGLALSPLTFLREQRPLAPSPTLKQEFGAKNLLWHTAEARDWTLDPTGAVRLVQGDKPVSGEGQGLDQAARQAFEQGQWQRALELWQQAEQRYQATGQVSEQIRTQIHQIQTLQALGFHHQVQLRWSQLYPTVLTLEDPRLQVQAFHSLAIMYQHQGDWDQAQTWLDRSLALTADSAALELKSLTLLHLGNTARLAGQVDTALALYQQAIAQATIDPDRVQAHLNALNLLVKQQRWAESLRQIEQITPLLERLPTNSQTWTYRLNWATILLQIHRSRPHQTPGIESADPPWHHLPTLSQIDQDLAQIAAAAQQVGDLRLEFYALSQQGHAQELLGHWSQAEALTLQALPLGQSRVTVGSLYLVLWQLGRILEAQGDRSGAIFTYRQAVQTLAALRSDLAASSLDLQVSFQSQVEPLYRQLVALLLEHPEGATPPQAHLHEARQLIEALQLAELDDYFQDSCTVSRKASIETIDRSAAVIYTIILNDRLEVILSLPDRPLLHHSTPITAQALELRSYQLLRLLTTPLRASQIQVLEQLQDLHTWLVEPIQLELERNQIQTLVFVADGVLRTLPLSALHDGQQYLLERYNVVLAPGLEVLDTQPLDIADRRLLLGGLSKGRDPFMPLPFVKTEIDNITRFVPHYRLYLDENFTLSNLKLDQDPAEVIHLASHGEFGSSAEETFILTWDGRLTIEDVGEIVKTRSTAATTVDLLVLSACKTATGDSRSVLGIAGMAIRSNARSVIAGLWPLNDQATAVFMDYFYKALAQPGITKAAAFRQAQLALMTDGRFQSPFYWSPYILVGNWL